MVAIICHDAGGVEILSSWALRQNEDFCLVLAGPAVVIFKRKLNFTFNLSIESAIAESDWVITGSSWQSDLERNAIRFAKKRGTKVVTFLDHWVNYIEHFGDGKTYSFPDEIWVGDSEALKIARKTFSNLPVLLTIKF